MKAPKKARGLRCSFYTEAIYAAMNGQGIALGWNRLVADLIQQTRLGPPHRRVNPHQSGLFCCGAGEEAKKESGRLFIGWLREVSR